VLFTLGYISRLFPDDTATTDLCTLSLHDALPILSSDLTIDVIVVHDIQGREILRNVNPGNTLSIGHFTAGIYIFKIHSGNLFALDRKSTRLNSSHVKISYAVFCLKKKTSLFTTHI